MLRKPILLVLLAVCVLAVPAVASDSGSTPHNAELQIVGENLAVDNGSGNAAPADNLAAANLELADSALRLAVKDQIVSWENPYAFLSTSNNQMLYFLLRPRRPGAC
jgi:hypothetical protein